MTLLIEVMERPLDPGYAEAAARRREAEAAGQVRRRTPAARAGMALLALVLGLATAAASHQLRVPQPGVAEAREVLERQILDRNAQVAELDGAAQSLSAEISALQQSALSTEDPQLLETIRVDGLRNGSLAVTGPGLVVSLTDGGGGLVGDEDTDVRVRDADLQIVVNALWAAGAEGVSIDDQRLTATSAVRNAGDAVLVDLMPLNGPTYVVRAVGDAEAMQTALARSDVPAYLQLLGSQYGIRSSVVAQSSLQLPGAGAQTLRHAQPVGSGADGDSSIEEDQQ
ncbi:DUF881 domain-containing protein [Xylanimonas oleitrophica]|uniref:DUF881 domain-containing protein n=2 Tax=Xylanimonas oleitrophica TaxID=2607479 RepID=A0A2W5WNV1_9MICO|nr:DUF881 domain-containing protein [Xylanimonas oleitrophica]